MELTTLLADLYRDTRWEALSHDTIERCGDCILDHVANVVAAASFPEARAILHFCGPSLDAAKEALILGTLGEILESQDGYRYGGVHPGSSVLPAALAAAGMLGASGRQLVEAIVIGYEVACRLGAGTHPGQTQRGFLPTGTAGAFGAAAALCKLAGETVEDFLSCLGICGCLVPMAAAENLLRGYTIKPVHGGQAARAGIESWQMLRAGFAGFPGILEGPRGFLRMTAPEVDWDAALSTRGPQPCINQIYFKPYPSCRHTHGAITAARDLVTRGLDWRDVDTVTVRAFHHATIVVGGTPNPGANYIECQFSLPFTVAATLVDGTLTPVALRADRRSRPEVRELMERVRVISEPRFTEAYPRQTPAAVEVRDRAGGEWQAEVRIPPGDPEQPLDRAALREKFDAFTAHLPRAERSALAEHCLTLSAGATVAEFTADLLTLIRGEEEEVR